MESHNCDIYMKDIENVNYFGVVEFYHLGFVVVDTNPMTSERF